MAMAAGEPLPMDLKSTIGGHCDSLWNVYGPTETTVCCNVANVDSQWTEGSVGPANANTQLYVVDPNGELLPVGIPGELWIAGDGVAAGYLNQPSLTASKFIPDPFANKPGCMIYKSGDLCRRLENGHIEVCGRIDTQVKLRGYRIELGEIESVARQAPGVRDVVVVVAKKHNGDPYLLGYFIPHRSGSVANEVLEETLKSKLPVYMIPRIWEEVDQFPQTGSGKIDRKQLANRFTSSLEVHHTDVFSISAGLESFKNLRKHSFDSHKLDWTQLELSLADLWTDVLGLPPNSRDQSFFAAGGQSLSAVRFLVAVREKLAKVLPFRDFFASPTIRQMAQCLHDAPGLPEAVQSQTSSVSVATSPTIFPASFPQRSLWVLDQVTDELTAYNIPLAWRIDGPLDCDSLRSALSRIVEVHEPLRTVFDQDPQGIWQHIKPAGSLKLPIVDFTMHPIELRDSMVKQWMRQESLRPFDLRNDDMLRCQLAKLEDRTYILFILLHHIAVDGWSLSCLQDELSTRYHQALLPHGATEPDNQSRYVDYTSQQLAYSRSESAEKDIKYWLDRLGDLEPLELPTDYPRPKRFSYRGRSLAISIDEVLASRIAKFCAEHDATQHVFLLTVFKILLATYADSSDVPCVVPVASRDRKEWESLIGYFINTVVVRSCVDKEKRFVDLLREVNQHSADAYDHSRIPFESVVEALRLDPLPDRNPIAQTLFQLMDFESNPLRFDGLRTTEYDIAIDRVRFDLEVILQAELCPDSKSRSIRGHLNYCSDLWSETTMIAFLEHYLFLIDQCILHPDSLVADLTRVSEPAKGDLIKLEQADLRPELLSQCVPDLIAKQCEETPDAIAVVYGDQQVTYRELEHQANALASRFIEQRIHVSDRVAILLGRDISSVVALLAIWKVGAVYLPLDPTYPKERIDFFIEDAAPSLLLTCDALAGLVEFPPNKTLIFSPASVPDSTGVQVKLSDAAYLLYTSGSTGKPKGVEVPHRTLANMNAWQKSHPRLGVPAKTLQFASQCFDVSLQEITCTLTTGGTLFLIDDSTRKDPQALLDYLNRQAIERLYLPFVMLDALMIANEAQSSRREKLVVLKDIISAGESLKLTEPIRRFLLQHPECKLHNHYGPTETHVITETMVDVAQYEAGAEVHIGRPIPNSQVLVLDKRLERVPRGAIGELFLAGAHLANGYFNKPHLTAERFLSHPFPKDHRTDCESNRDASELVIYRTGDRARWRHDGAIEFLGRSDDQVKFRGHRIELGEIEHYLCGLTSIRQAHVTVRKVGEVSRLIAYVVPAVSATADVDMVRCDTVCIDTVCIDTANIGTANTGTARGGLSDGRKQLLVKAWQSALQSVLPSYMLPQDYVVLSAFPQTPSGKLDKRNLPLPNMLNTELKVGFEPPKSGMEKVLAECWARLFSSGDGESTCPVGSAGTISVDASFMELGMHSLLAMRFAVLIQQRISGRVEQAAMGESQSVARRVPVRWLFEYPTIALLASQLEEAGFVFDSVQENDLGDSNDVRGKPQYGPLSPSQSRLWFLDQLEEDSSHYHIQSAWLWQGECCEPTLRLAFAELIQRHESLRTKYSQVDGVPLQIVLQSVDLDFESIDLSRKDGLAQLGESLQQERKWLMDRTYAPFDLANGLLIRGSLIQRRDKEYVLSLVVHHIAADGQSLILLKKDLLTFYRKFVERSIESSTDKSTDKSIEESTEGSVALSPREPLQPSGVLQEFCRVGSPTRYLDYAIGLSKSNAIEQSDVDYWGSQLQGLTPVELPTDYLRPTRLSYRGGQVDIAMEQDLLDSIEQACHVCRCSLNTFLLAGYKLLLARYARQKDIAVALPVLGRESQELDQVVGFFVNTLIVRTQLESNQSIQAWVEKVGKVALDAMEHRGVPFEHLVDMLKPERRLNQNPFSSVLFQTVDLRDTPVAIPGVDIQDHFLEIERVRFDLEMHWFQGQARVQGVLCYAEDLFERSFAREFASQYGEVLRAMVSGLQLPVDQLRLMSNRDLERITHEWNANGWDLTYRGRVEERFWDQVAATPNAVAIGEQSRDWTYLELGAYAKSIEQSLIEAGIEPGSRVAVLLPRSSEYVATLIAVLSAGCTYVPLDPNYPMQRLEFMVGDSQAQAILCSKRFVDQAKELHSRNVLLQDAQEWFSDWQRRDDAGQSHSPQYSALMDLHSNLAQRVNASAPPSEFAYVMYTSGSTGRPKGVAIPHSGIIRLIVDADYLKIDSAKRVLFLSSIAFDASTFEVWGALLNGASTAIPPEELLLDLQKLGEWMQRKSVTTTWLSAGLFNTWIETAPEGLSKLQEILTGGEALSVPHVVQAQSILGDNVQLINGYGPTENTTFTACHRIEHPFNPRRRSVPIGRPIRGTRTYVVDEQFRILPPGVPGELITSGYGLAAGYLGDAIANQAKFISDHHIDGEGAMYRTGDLCRWRSDGTLEFLGRIDRQIKLRGFRIEPSEIQAVLEACPGVQRALVNVLFEGSNAVGLDAFIVLDESSKVSLGDVRQTLRDQLPAYMIPERLFSVDHFPLTPQGKVDIGALVKLAIATEVAGGLPQKESPSDPVIQELCEIWSKLLRQRRGDSPMSDAMGWDVTCDFFAAGGHSLLAIQLFHHIEKSFSVRLPLATIFRHGSIQELASQIRLQSQGGQTKRWVERLALSASKRSGNGRALPLVFVLPGLGGELLFARNLVSQYAEDFHWIGLQPKLKAEECDGIPLDDFVATAKEYVQAILDDVPKEPFALIGFSYGGTLAYEIARQLSEVGSPSNALIVLDTGPGDSSKTDRIDESSLRKLSRRTRTKISNSCKILANMPHWMRQEIPRVTNRQWWLTQSRKISDRLKSLQRKGSSGRSVHTVLNLNNAPTQNAQMRQKVYQAVLDYRPLPFEGRVTLIRSRVQPLLKVLPRDYGWSRVAKEVDVVILPGDHESLLGSPSNLKRIANEIHSHFKTKIDS
jgi:amino acid adenylation domain-containing protein